MADQSLEEMLFLASIKVVIKNVRRDAPVYILDEELRADIEAIVNRLEADLATVRSLDVPDKRRSEMHRLSVNADALCKILAGAVSVGLPDLK